MTEAPFPTRPPLVAVVASPPLPSPSPPPLNMPSSLVQQPTVASRGLQPGDGGCPTRDDSKAQADANLEAASEFLVTLTFVTASLAKNSELSNINRRVQPLDEPQLESELA